MDEDWKEFISKEMEKSLDEVMDEIEADPEMKDVQSPEGMYDNVVAMIREHEQQEAYEQLSDEDKELIQLGRVYKKQRRFDKFVVALAAVIVGLGIGSVCMGENENIFRMISSMFVGQEQVVVNSDDTENLTYIEEDEAYAKIEKKFKFTPVRLEYLPQQTVFHEAIFSNDMQYVNMIYIKNNETSIIYSMRPNYRESSYGIVIEDAKIQEYKMYVEDVEITVVEYNIAETGASKWSARFVHQDVYYMLRLNNMQQGEVEKVLTNLRFLE